MEAVNCKELPLTVPPFARTSSPLLTLSELELVKDGADWNVRIPLLNANCWLLKEIEPATVRPMLLALSELPPL